MKGSGRDSTRLGWCSRGASLPAEHSWLCLGAGGNPSVSGAHLVHSSTAKAFLQDTFQHSVAELGAQGTGSTGRTGGLTSPQPQAQLGAKVQQCLVDHHKCKKFKNQQLPPSWEQQLPSQEWLCQRGWQQEALGSRSWRGWMPSAVPAPSLRYGLMSSSLAVPHGSALLWVQPFPGPGMPGWMFPGAPSPLRGRGSGWDPPCSRREW